MFAAGWEVAMATMYLLLMLSTKLFTIMALIMTLVITKTVAQEHYSALNATTWLQILSERKTWAILNFPEWGVYIKHFLSVLSSPLVSKFRIEQTLKELLKEFVRSNQALDLSNKVCVLVNAANEWPHSQATPTWHGNETKPVSLRSAFKWWVYE